MPVKEKGNKKEGKMTRRPKTKGKTAMRLGRPALKMHEFAAAVTVCRKCDKEAKDRIKLCGDCVVLHEQAHKVLNCDKCPIEVAVKFCRVHHAMSTEFATAPQVERKNSGSFKQSLVERILGEGEPRKTRELNKVMTAHHVQVGAYVRS